MIKKESEPSREIEAIRVGYMLTVAVNSNGIDIITNTPDMIASSHWALEKSRHDCYCDISHNDIVVASNVVSSVYNAGIDAVINDIRARIKNQHDEAEKVISQLVKMKHDIVGSGNIRM